MPVYYHKEHTDLQLSGSASIKTCQCIVEAKSTDHYCCVLSQLHLFHHQSLHRLHTPTPATWFIHWHYCIASLDHCITPE